MAAPAFTEVRPSADDLLSLRRFGKTVASSQSVPMRTPEESLRTHWPQADVQDLKTLIWDLSCQIVQSQVRSLMPAATSAAQTSNPGLGLSWGGQKNPSQPACVGVRLSHVQSLERAHWGSPVGIKIS